MKESGIYAIFAQQGGERRVYVGQSIDMARRFAHHAGYVWSRAT